MRHRCGSIAVLIGTRRSTAESATHQNGRSSVPDSASSLNSSSICTTGGLIRIGLTVITCGLAGIIGFVEGILYLTKSDEEFVQTYLVEKRAWF